MLQQELFLLEVYKYTIQHQLQQEQMYWLEKKDITYLQEYVSSTESAKRGQPKYYAMFGGATGESDTTSGRMMFGSSS